MGPAIGIAALAILASIPFYLRLRQFKRTEHIRAYMFPNGLFAKLHARHPAMSAKDTQLTARALRQFFLAYLKSGRSHVAMPSRMADDLWHEFILYTQAYEQFCRQAFGRFLHHTPAAALRDGHSDIDGLRRAWWFACLEENINPRTPTRLPLLFALDEKLGFADGSRYTLDDGRRLAPARELRHRGSGSGSAYCGASACSSGSSSDAGCTGGCSGGCGGGGD